MNASPFGKRGNTRGIFNVKKGCYDKNRILPSYGEGYYFGTNVNANNESLTYNKNGNITSLTRYRKGTGLIDNLVYTYKNGNASNMLDQVDDAVAGDNGFSEYVKRGNEYTFDGNGNLTSDAYKGR